MADVETPRVRLVVKGARGIGETHPSESGAFFDPCTFYCSCLDRFCVLIERFVSDCQVQSGDVVLRTAAIAKTTTPTWCQNFTFGIKKPLGDVVRFKVFGMREHGRDVLLGSASLLMETLTPDTLTTHELALVDANDVVSRLCSSRETWFDKHNLVTVCRLADI
ncbi:hypothetical protein PsorP6_019399 [Peronosclerospora sorghi]|nr:hypothetical protein PsorP6_019399 [Peronosclerospora sorghi]